MEYREGQIRKTEFFTTSELAKKLKMNVQVITRKVQSGEIQAYKIGKDWRIPEQSVHAWLEMHSNQNNRTTRQKVVSNFVKDEHIEKLPAQRSKRKYLLEYILAQFGDHGDVTAQFGRHNGLIGAFAAKSHVETRTMERFPQARQSGNVAD